MDVGDNTQVNETKKRGVRRVWTKEEELTLLCIMEEVVAYGGLTNCGSFKAGMLKIIEIQLKHALPNCGLRASPHIESKLKVWKRQYGVIYNMLNSGGFAWNDLKKCVEVDNDEAWQTYVQHHKQAKGWRDKPFPIYERLAKVFGKDRGNGKIAKTIKNLQADIEVDDNFGNQFRIPKNSSPMSINQIESDYLINQTSSQSLRKKKPRFIDPLVRSMDKFTNLMKYTIDQTNATLNKFYQIVVETKVNENRLIANDLIKIGLDISDQVRIMQKLMKKPEIAEIFKAQSNEEQKLQFVKAVLSGQFDN